MISRLTIRRLVLISTITTLVSLGLMVMGIVFPKPILLVLAMSLGQLFGTLSLALYLLAIVLDLQGVGEHDDIRPHIGFEAAERAEQGETKQG
jgi:membrane protein required for beta-lactamase induction